MDAITRKNKGQAAVDAVLLLRTERVPLTADELADRGFVVDDSVAIMRAVQVAITAHAIDVAKKIVGKTVRKYSWIDGDDLQQELLIPVPRWIGTFSIRHSSGTSWSKYLYHKMNFYIKDVLRKEDPVGIGFPQREHYPTWYRLGDRSGFCHVWVQR